MSKLGLIILSLMLYLVICEAACTHPAFIWKHVCSKPGANPNCNDDPVDAKQFALRVNARRVKKTGRNTVFIANNMQYHAVFSGRHPITIVKRGSNGIASGLEQRLRHITSRLVIIFTSGSSVKARLEDIILKLREF